MWHFLWHWQLKTRKSNLNDNFSPFYLVSSPQIHTLLHFANILCGCTLLIIMIQIINCVCTVSLEHYFFFKKGGTWHVVLLCWLLINVTQHKHRHCNNVSCLIWIKNCTHNIQISLGNKAFRHEPTWGFLRTFTSLCIAIARETMSLYAYLL